MATEASAKNLVLTSAIITLGATSGAKLLPENLGGAGELPSPRVVIGTAVAFTVLSMAAPYAPNFVSGWAILMLSVSVLNTAAPMLDKFLNETGKGDPAKPKRERTRTP